MSPDKVDVREDVLAAARARAAALAAGDATRLEALLHERFRWTTHRGEVFDRAEYVRRNTGGHTSWRSQELSGTEVVVVGETAVLYAEVTDVVQHGPTDAQTFAMPMTQTWVQTQNGWQCLAGHAGPLRA